MAALLEKRRESGRRLQEEAARKRIEKVLRFRLLPPRIGSVLSAVSHPLTAPAKRERPEGTHRTQGLERQGGRRGLPGRHPFGNSDELGF